MKHFLIEKMKNVDWGKVIAVLDIIILDHTEKHLLTLKDCRLITGTNGIFVKGPSRKLDKPYKNKDGKMVEYLDLVFFDVNHRDELSKLAENHYDPSGNYPGTIVTDTATTGTATTKETAEADIPF